jgi:putative multiple sugar transport system permease protein
MGTVYNVLKSNMRQYAMLIALVVIMAFFQIMTDGILLVPMNVTNLVLQNSYVLILAIGMMLCILAGGHIDLSVGSLCALISAIVGALIINMKMDVTLGITIGVLLGVIVGMWQGFWIAYIRIPSFIVTLAGMLVFRGLTLSILQGLTLAPFPESFVQISAGFVPDFLNVFNMDMNVTTIVVGIIMCILYVVMQLRNRRERQKYSFEITPVPLFITQIIVVLAGICLFTYWLAAYKGLPIIFVVISILVVAYTIFTTKTVPGRYIYAMGGNEKAAQLSGINTNRTLFMIYVNMGVLSAVAGICFASRLNAASPLTGQNFELDAIAACFIGGASAYGGIGTVIGGVIGALVMGVLNNGMSIMGMSTDIQQTIKGLVLLMAVAFDVFSKMKSK